MPGENNQYVNPNLADTETLRRLPGIGAEIAKRIAEARPFADVEDLRRVPGLGQSTLERIAPYLTFDSDQGRLDGPGAEGWIEEGINGRRDPQVVAMPAGDESQEESFGPLAETTSARIKPDEPSREIPKKAVEPPASQKGYSRSESLWLMAGIGTLTLIFSVILSLAIVGGINGTLDFRQIAAFRSLQSDVAIMDGNLESISADLDSMTQRLEALEGLTGRVVTVEEQVDLLQSDVESALDTVETMQGDIERIDGETARLSEHVAAFDAFLQGLREVLNAALGTTPEEAPMP